MRQRKTNVDGEGEKEKKNGERKNDRHCVRTKVFDRQLWMELEANPPLGPR